MMRMMLMTKEMMIMKIFISTVFLYLIVFIAFVKCLAFEFRLRENIEDGKYMIGLSK